MAQTIIKLKLTELKENPENPRFIRDEKFQKLVQSMKDFPEMVEARPLIINEENVILGGNMRYKAAKEAGWKEIDAIRVNWSYEKQMEFIAKDNIGFGEWDWEQLANQYEAPELEEWGLDLPDGLGDEEKEAKPKVPTINVTFETVEDMERAMIEISELANEFGGVAKTNV